MEMQDVHKNIIKSYASSYHRRIVSQGLWMDREDLEGEFCICYAKALKMFRKNSGAKFETYLITAINNKFRDILNKLIYDAKKKLNCIDLNQDTEASYFMVEVNDAIRDIYDKLTPRERVIMHDMLSPSPELLEFIPSDCSPRKYMGSLQWAIAEVRGFHHNEVKYCLSRIRKKVKRALTIK